MPSSSSLCPYGYTSLRQRSAEHPTAISWAIGVGVGSICFGALTLIFSLCSLIPLDGFPLYVWVTAEACFAIIAAPIGLVARHKARAWLSDRCAVEQKGLMGSA